MPPTPAKTYSNAHHAVVIADVTAVCHLHGASFSPCLLLYLRPLGSAPVTFDFADETECAAYYAGLIAAMG